MKHYETPRPYENKIRGERRAHPEEGGVLMKTFKADIYDPEFYIIWALLSQPEVFGPKAMQIPNELFLTRRELFSKLIESFRRQGVEGLINSVADLIDEEMASLIRDYDGEYTLPSELIFERSARILKERTWKNFLRESFEKLERGEISLEEFTMVAKEIHSALEEPPLTLKDVKNELLKEDEENPIMLPLIGVEVYPSDIVLITAKTKSGKTTLALNMALKLLQREEELRLAEEGEFRPVRKVMYITYEITTKHLFKMLVGIEKGKSWKEITPQDKEEFIDRYGENISLQFGLDLEKLLSYVWVFHPDVFIIDYDQLVPTKGRFESEERRVAHIVRSLKDVATQTGSVCILLSQVNEDGQARYSREKEHASSVHIHLERDESNEELIHYEVKLNRWGRSGIKGTLRVDWETRKMTLENLLDYKGV